MAATRYEDDERPRSHAVARLVIALSLLTAAGCHTDQPGARLESGAPPGPAPVATENESPTARSADARSASKPILGDDQKMLGSGWLKSLERSLLFFPARYPDGDWQPSGLKFEDAWFNASDGVRLHGWFVPCDRPGAVVLFAHGNGGNLSHRADTLTTLHDRLHVASMIFDYRGYGRSEGTPDAAGILLDGRAARRWLAERAAVKENEIVLMGESLGGAVVVDMAAADGARGLVLDSTFSSLPDVASFHYPFLPVAALTKTRLDSAGLIAKYHGPLLQFHGDKDQIIPIKLGRKLFDAANEPKRFVVMPGHDHNDPRPAEFFAVLDEFLDSLK